ncbi:hypothetical protein CEXT_183411 [Caerostris extrusa]|uniref:C2H2-type domain-containing protein n=1 Tax=Caerostris extrusa TaxID=172846 RepID=A0AAV4SWQ2_CAEEX|nr:hypothetical protein CEXT_183411 [Caerostris extrusa]
MYFCTLCPYSTPFQQQIESHQDSHSDNLDFTCAICQRKFSTRKDLEIHYRSHSKVFPCSVCNKVFNQKCNLKVHFRIHTGERPFHCNVCDKRFHRKQDMQKHSWTHQKKP